MIKHVAPFNAREPQSDELRLSRIHSTLLPNPAPFLSLLWRGVFFCLSLASRVAPEKTVDPASPDAMLLFSGFIGVEYGSR